LQFSDLPVSPPNTMDRFSTGISRAGVPFQTVSHLSPKQFQEWVNYMSSRLRAAVQAGLGRPQARVPQLYHVLLQHELVSTLIFRVNGAAS